MQTLFTNENPLKLIDELYKIQRPFVFYRKGGTTELRAIIQKDNVRYTTDTLQESGFIVAPFNTDKEKLFFPIDKSDFLNFDISELVLDNVPPASFEAPFNKETKKNHIDLVQRTIDFIHKGEANKIVISRKITYNFNSIEFSELFLRILLSYPDAFVNIWFHPKEGLWIGATPESLVKFNKQVFSTMALAGTQLYADTIKWTEKEIEEQKWVTDFIVNQLLPIVDTLKVSNPSTVKAGHLAHIRTDISGLLSDEYGLKNIIRALHPTPAVCGVPRKIAGEFINNNEAYDRTFYTGYIGELNIENQTNLFVNLRCMQIVNKQVHLYVGGGITKESIAENEWQETCNKAAILNRLLEL